MTDLKGVPPNLRAAIERERVLADLPKVLDRIKQLEKRVQDLEGFVEDGDAFEAFLSSREADKKAKANKHADSNAKSK